MAFFKNKFDSIKQDWNTPKNLFNKINQEFNFTCDLSASADNTLCEKYFTREDNALSKKWEGICWCNPPYGDKDYKMVDFIKKAYNDTQNDPNLTVVMLIPARTNTKWFHDYCLKSNEVKFICGRPKFGDSKHGLPQPLIIVVFKKSDATKFSSFYI